MVKLLVTLAYTVAVASFPASAVVPLAPYLLYPVLCSAVGGVSPGLLSRRTAAALPFALLLGIAGPFLDHTPALEVGGAVISRGWMSLFAIAFRTLLVVSAALCLTALSGFAGICDALERLRLPKLLVLQLRLMFRHFSTISEETGRTLLAYRLRSGRQRGVAPREWGGIAGGVLLRSIDRAERVHAALLLRGGGEPLPASARGRPRRSDWLFFLSWSSYFSVCRLVDVPALLGALVTGVSHG